MQKLFEKLPIEKLSNVQKWCKFLLDADNPAKQTEVQTIAETEVGIMKAMKTLSKISTDDIMWKQQLDREVAIRDYNSGIAFQKRENEKLQAEKNRLQSEIEKSNAEIEKAQAEIEKSKSEIEKSKSEIEKSKSEIEKSKSEIEKSKSEIEKSKSEMKKAQSESANKQRKIAINMKQEKLSIDIIAKCTGLTVEEIKKL